MEIGLQNNLLFFPLSMHRENLLDHRRQNDFMILLELWKSVRSETIVKLQSISSQLQQVCQSVRKARISGKCISTVGGAMATAGFALLPFTFGVSLGLAVPGTALLMVGVGTSMGSTIADACKMNHGIKNATASMAVDSQLSQEIDKSSNAKANQSMLNPDKTAAKVVSYSFAESTDSAMCSTLKVAANLVTVPVDLFDVAVNSCRVLNNKLAKTVLHLNQQVAQLQRQLDSPPLGDQKLEKTVRKPEDKDSKESDQSGIV